MRETAQFPTSRKIVLIGNYRPDKQESMIRFAHLLNSGFKDEGIDSEIWWPTGIFGSSISISNSGIGKWLGYIDKYFIFPLVLKRRLNSKNFKSSSIHYHICDHSNAPYLKYFPANRTSITCHDVIAIKGGLGLLGSYQPASKMGKILQKWILSYLNKANSIAFVSQLTFNQFCELCHSKTIRKENWKVIHNAFNAEFKPMPSESAKKVLKRLGIDDTVPFILHVGSGLPRKNRRLLLDMASIMESATSLNICFAGEPINSELVQYSESLGLQDRVFSIVKPDHLTLVALYSSCEAFIFPSFSEGFGWPVIEAQACGAPVIASNIEPMPEISGGAALHFDPRNPNDFVKGYLSLQNKDSRQKLIDKGFENGSRFDNKRMIKAYLNFYRKNS
ncbi:glycosyltransferase family 4 protein [Segetibacter aerophilus]|uniref:Mannosyltransferase n=1 Tax=Segetibacter aerophilus TaxID=670293 RepID=A0A512BES5_9BACT|nr:glycosyltransferase family 1 protein [Segetibacter aerophilus]GEO10452.1 mannosyltransferase [Segetibacter aerophilus]